MKKIFFAYSENEKDVELYKQFNKHFAAYAKKGLIAIVDRDEMFKVNNDRTRVEEFLRTADITVPLLSVDYVASDECIQLLDKATGSRQMIIPVLLRDFNWEEMEEIRGYESSLLPEDRQSVNAHVSKDADKDEVFANMARRVKGIMFNEFESVVIRKSSGTFYYILALILVAIGALAGFFSYSKWGDWMLSGIVFLMFACIALFAVKNVLFPTKFKVN